ICLLNSSAIIAPLPYLEACRYSIFIVTPLPGPSSGSRVRDCNRTADAVPVTGGGRYGAGRQRRIRCVGQRRSRRLRMGLAATALVRVHRDEVVRIGPGLRAVVIRWPAYVPMASAGGRSLIAALPGAGNTIFCAASSLLTWLLAKL